MLTTGEVFPTQRLLDTEVEGTEMVGVEHLGQYVFEMTGAKVEMLKRGETALPPQDANIAVEEDEMDRDGGEVEVDAEEEPEEFEELDKIS